MTESRANSQKFRVFFDGACHLCSREIRHYRKLPASKDFDWVDISTPHFQATDFGLDEKKVNEEMHVMDEKGELHIGVMAFVEIWKRLPRWRLLARVVQWPIIFSAAKLGYIIFAYAIRPYLPKKKSCAIS